MGLMLPLLQTAEIHTSVESLCARPHSELSHVILRTSLFIIALVIGEETEA